jgi:uncharacterized RDD family membrane protein YckC
MAGDGCIGISIMNEDQETPRNVPVPPPDLPQGPVTGGVPPVAPGDSKPVAPPSAEVAVRIKPAAEGEDAAEAGAIAPFNSRVVAALIDGVIAGGLTMTALWVLPGFAERVGWLVGIAYLVTRDSLPFLGGRSVGKTAMKLRVVTLEGKDITGNWEAAIVRNAVLAIPLFAFVELFVLLSREDKPDHGRRLGDEWAKTKVVTAPDPVEENTEE